MSCFVIVLKEGGFSPGLGFVLLFLNGQCPGRYPRSYYALSLQWSEGQGAVACHALCCCLLFKYSFGLMDFLASFPLMHQRGWISALRSPTTASPGCF